MEDFLNQLLTGISPAKFGLIISISIVLFIFRKVLKMILLVIFLALTLSIFIYLSSDNSGKNITTMVKTGTKQIMEVHKKAQEISDKVATELDQ